MVTRDFCYFEPRVISMEGSIRWYGETYRDEQLIFHTEETVYIRDNSEELSIYTLSSEEKEDGNRIKAVFTQVCKIRKYQGGWRYGRKVLLH